jgi:hypothetical protein
MNTLQKIADLETAVANLAAKQQMFEVLASGVPTLKQEIGSVTNDQRQIIKAVEGLIHGVNKKTSDLAGMDNMLVTRLMGLEQSYASLSKTLGAIVSELSDSKILNQESVMARLRKGEEAADKERTEQMVQLKVLQEAPEILPDSLIVVAQTYTDKEGKVDLIAEYRSMELSSPMIDEETRKNYVGKKANDVVELNLEDGVLKTTILQVYSYVQKFAEGQAEQPAQAEEAVEVEQPAQPETTEEKSEQPEASNQ